MSRMALIISAILIGLMVGYFYISNGFGIDTYEFWTLSLLTLLAIGGLLKKTGLL